MSRRTFLVATGTLLLSGCGGGSPPDDVRVVAVHAGTDRQARPVLGDRGRAVLRAAAESDRGTLTVVVAGAPDLTRTLDLVVRREPSGQVEHGPRRAELIDARLAEAEAAVTGAVPVTGTPDLLAGIAVAARGTPGTLLVLDSGITTTDPLDLRLIGWEAEPAEIVERLRTADLLPDLRGWEVVLVGLGRVAGGQAAPGTAQLRWLERFWTAVCTASGARGCAVEPVLERPADPDPAIRSTALVPVPVVATVAGPGGVVETTLPDSLLGFGPGSAELAPDATAALAPVVAAYRRAPSRVLVAGFVALWGSESYRAELSQRRADAVARMLGSLGVAAADMTAEGRGAADGPAASTTGGRFDEAKVVANGIRRVVVTVEPRR
ncbi:MAG: OmpA family protein [Pseudonocardia sp.]|nr:OmpA family protein [Pseudonocardia sp.]